MSEIYANAIGVANGIIDSAKIGKLTVIVVTTGTG
jgi:hypothetical protein